MVNTLGLLQEEMHIDTPQSRMENLRFLNWET